MIVIDEALLDEFRNAGRCEWCHRKRQVEGHHVMCKGMGGGARMDVRINLIALCRVCHTLVHAGTIDRDMIIEIVAAREGVPFTWLKDELLRMRYSTGSAPYGAL